jgi:very-short-patch-repair endonuclease
MSHPEILRELIAPEDASLFARYVPAAKLKAVASAHYSIAPSATTEIEAAMAISLCAEFLDEIVSCDGYTWSVVQPQFRLSRLAPKIRFVLDFLVSVGGRSIGVECDGKAWHGAPQQKNRDAWRDNLIKNACGLRVVRFSGAEIIRDAPACAAKVRQELLS